jgi:uncharacterized membrane protein (DUF485 family)
MVTPGSADPEQSAFRQASETVAYRTLVHERSRFTWALTAIMLAIYFGYILLIAFNRGLLARPIGGGTTTLGIPLGIGVILSAIVLTSIYVARSNRRFDALTEEIVAEAGL